MVRRHTGAGRFRTLRENSEVVTGIIHNFDHDWHELKREHVNWITDHVVPLLSQGGGSVELTGMTSRKGNQDYNRRLGKRRADSAWSVIRIYTPPRLLLTRHLNPSHEHGEFIATQKGERDETETSSGLYRAVWISARTVSVPSIRCSFGIPQARLAELNHEKQDLRERLRRLRENLHNYQQTAVDYGSDRWEADDENARMEEIERIMNSPYGQGPPTPGQTAQGNWRKGQTRRLAEVFVERTAQDIEAVERRLDVIQREIAAIVDECRIPRWR